MPSSPKRSRAASSAEIAAASVGAVAVAVAALALDFDLDLDRDEIHSGSPSWSSAALGAPVLLLELLLARTFAGLAPLFVTPTRAGWGFACACGACTRAALRFTGEEGMVWT